MEHTHGVLEESQLPKEAAASTAWTGRLAAYVSRLTAWQLVALLLLALVLFGDRYHWVEAAGTAERDGFVEQAEGLLHGKLPHDAFRPPLYPILTVLLAGIVGDAFVAARLISNLAAAGLAFGAFELGRRLKSKKAGFWAMALTIANPNLWVFGEIAATDMLFACFATATLVAGLTYLQRPTPRAALLAGACYGLSDFVRSNGFLLLGPLTLAYLWAPSRQRSVRHLAWSALSGALVLTPLWILRWQEFGSPFHDENWKNLWWKLHGGYDWSLLDNAPPSSMLGLLKNEPGLVARSAIRELANFVRTVLPNLLGGWWTVLFFALSATSIVLHRKKPGMFLLAALGFFVLSLACVFFVWDRFLLFSVPVVAALCFSELDQTLTRYRDATWRRTLPAVGVAVLALTSARTILRRMPEFVRLHPYGEVRVLRGLQPTVGPLTTFAGTAPYLQRYLRNPYVAIPDAKGSSEGEPYLRQLQEFLLAHHAQYLVVSDAELSFRPKWLLGGPASASPSWLTPMWREAGVMVWRVSTAENSAGSSPKN